MCFIVCATYRVFCNLEKNLSLYLSLSPDLNYSMCTVFFEGQSASYYIGVTDSFLEGQWVYSYARTLIRVRPHWLNGGPDNYHNEDCVEVVSSQSGQWSDVQCTTSLFYICEYDNE